MVSFMSFLKTTLVLGFTLAVTAVSVYSAAMSTYNYMMPVDMGICALRQYHMGLFARFQHDELAQLFIHYMYSQFRIPQCQFHPNIPVSWINWMDKPARAYLPFHKFCYILARFQVQVLTPFYTKLAILFFASCLGVYLSYYILRWTLIKVAQALQVLFHVTRLAWNKILGLIGTGISFLVSLLLSFAGGAFSKATMIPIVMMLTLSSVLGFRLAVFITAYGLALWSTIIVLDWIYSRVEELLGGNSFDKRWARYEEEAKKRMEKKRIERDLVDAIVGNMMYLAQVDQAIAADILQMFQAIYGGEMNATAAVGKIKMMFKKLAIKYHPDKNSAPAATQDMAYINGIKEKMNMVFDHPIEELPFYKAAMDFLSIVKDAQGMANVE